MFACLKVNGMRLTADAVVVGAGVIGASAALELSKTGRRVLVVDKLAGPVTSPDLLQQLRAVEVLERIGTPEARALLQPLAKGAPGHRLTEAARGAVGMGP